MPTLHVPSFAGGVVRAGSSDAQATTELRNADNWDIGLRGQLMSAPTTTDFLGLPDAGSPLGTLAPVAGGTVKYGTADPQMVVVGFGKDNTNTLRYCAVQVALATGLSGNPAVKHVFPITTQAVPDDGAPTYTNKIPWVTFAPFPYVNSAGLQTQALFVNLGARYDDAHPREMPGLYVVVYDGSDYAFQSINLYDALGTGSNGEYTGGTHGLQLYPRGICAYNNHLFLFGFDNADATLGEGPARLMFSNVANPFKFGNDNLAPVNTDRVFSDTDAITVGSGGESITGLLASQGKLWIGTNRGLHYLSGYGRDSFTTDGTTGVADSLDVAGPYGLIEGPDGHVYGLSSRGLWRYTWGYPSGRVEHLYRTLVAFDGSSVGYWDLLAGSGPIRGAANIDLAWLRSDVSRQQVWVVIPGCDATGGVGTGPDTVIIKYHTEGGGFTRQVLPGVLWYPTGEMRKGSVVSDLTVIPTSKTPALQKYGTGTPNAGLVTFGEYAPFGPDGEGVVRVVDLTVSWLSGSALPITATVTPTVDQQRMPSVHLTIGSSAPGSPSDGDTWVDTSGTDPNLGNATAGTLVVATGDYVVKRWIQSWGKWVIVPRAGGMQGTRVTVPIAVRATKGTRNGLEVVSSAGAIIQFEGLGLEPSVGASQSKEAA